LIVNDRHQIKEMLLRIVESGDFSECNSNICSLKVRYNTTINMIAPETIIQSYLPLITLKAFTIYCEGDESCGF
jgi:hypothetical protein